MIIAELHSKIPSKIEDKEDILTSNVFSFFKYSNRQLLMDYLCQLGIEVSVSDSKNAEFIFWPSYDDGTEPDLIIVCGKYYILFEAKLYSDFAQKTLISDSQIDREIKMGILAAENLNKEFVYVAITAEYNKDKIKYSKYENQKIKFIWTNWQTVTHFLEIQLSTNESIHINEFAKDLYSLLVKKKLRSYIGFINIQNSQDFQNYNSIFYNLNSSKFKGEFSGFLENLSGFEKIGQFKKFYQKSFFQNPKTFEIKSDKNIFYNGN